MASIGVRPLTDEHPFGARIRGVTHESLRDEAIRQQIRDVFEDRGMIVFEEIEASDALQIELSSVFGPAREYAIKGGPSIDEENMPGVIDIAADAGKATMYDFDGEIVAGWQRQTGEKVLHLAPWQAMAIEGQENAQGDALFTALWDEVLARMQPYWHQWRPDQMAIWDNWRFLHSVSGHDPKYPRAARRTTIAGDYGLGRFEGDPVRERA